MWNFICLLWVISGSYTAYYMIQDMLKTKGAIDAQDGLIVIVAFLGGFVSLGFLISQEGDKIVLFKKPREPQPQAAPVQPQQQTARPAYSPPPQQKQKRGGSVLDE